MASRIRVYMACSVDGFIADKEHGVSFLERAQLDDDGKLPPVDENSDAIQYTDFMKDIGVLVMGRNSYDTVMGFGIPWPYGEIPVLVATTRPLESPPETVRSISASIEEILTEAKTLADGKDVYLDGGNLIRQGLEAGLVDEMIITMVPVILGDGISLFEGLSKELRIDFQEFHRFNQRSLQWIATPR